jgi:RHS repeat-associated protein
LTSSGATTYAYTSENRLATGNGAQLAYDSVGRLSAVDKGAQSGSFDYVGDQMITERSWPSYGVTRRYVYGPGEDEPVIWYEGAGTTDKRFLHADERGSIVAVSNSTGASIATNKYDEYGIPASTNLGRFGYTGQTWIAELGMNYYKARMYSPTLGRFLQTDLLGYAYGMNWYAYVGGDPVNFSDPSGLCSFTTRGHFVQTWNLRKGAYNPPRLVSTYVVQDSPCDQTVGLLGDAPTQGGPSENSGGDSSDDAITVVATRPDAQPTYVSWGVYDCRYMGCRPDIRWPFPIPPKAAPPPPPVNAPAPPPEKPQWLKVLCGGGAAVGADRAGRMPSRTKVGRAARTGAIFGAGAIAIILCS